MISIIVAMDRKSTIGKDNKLPWRLPADLAYFKKITLGHTVIMGRKTFESIGKPLPGRKNVVLTRNKGYNIEGVTVCNSMEEAINKSEGQEAFIIGGADVYTEFFPHTRRLYITFIDGEFEGDSIFPDIDFKSWRLVSEEKGLKNSENPYDYYFRIYERIS